MPILRVITDPHEQVMAFQAAGLTAQPKVIGRHIPTGTSFAYSSDRKRKSWINSWINKVVHAFEADRHRERWKQLHRERALARRGHAKTRNPKLIAAIEEGRAPMPGYEADSKERLRALLAEVRPMTSALLPLN